MDPITELERQLIPEFRQRIADIELSEWRNHDMQLVTWLRARDHNLKKAEDMFRKSDVWFKAKNFENITKDWTPPEEYARNFGMDICGFDADDSPVLFGRPGSWDVRSAVEADGRELYLKYVTFLASDALEYTKEIMLRKNKFITQFVLILDLSGYSFRQLTSYATVETHLQAIRDFEANFPETLKACYVININSWFGAIFNLIKPILSGKTVSKLHMFGSNSDKWESILHNNVLNVDTAIFQGNLNNCQQNDEEEFDVVEVKRGDQLKLTFPIEGTNDVRIRWKFKTDIHDIGFGVNFINPCENLHKELIPVQRKPANQVLQADSLICDYAGDYIIIFDNTYSRLRSKTLYYSITIDDINRNDTPTIEN